MSLKPVAENYFKNLNSISTRLYDDLEEVKSSYEELWETIPEKEQQEILSESIIKPEITIKYNPVADDTIEKFAAKLIIDENCSYRDEHSGPFSFKTSSQRDLNIFCTKEMKNMTESKVKAPKVKSKAPPKPPLFKEQVDDSVLDIMDTGSTNSLLPKTGLDFLDNW